MRARMMVAALLVGSLVLGSGWSVGNDMPDEWRGPRDIIQPPIGADGPPAGEYRLAEGHALELVVGELTYPSAVAFGPDGTVYVAEAGYAHGPSTAIPRVLRVDADGEGDHEKQELARLPDGPLTGLAFHDGTLYVVGGRAPAKLWSVDPESGAVQELLAGMPVWGRHFTSDLAFDPEGRLHFAVGDPTNSGVLDLVDYHTYAYLSILPAAESIPCVDLNVRDVGFTTPNPFAADPKARTTTAPFHRFAEPPNGTSHIDATPAPRCTGGLFRWHEGNTTLVASGFRYVTGLGFAPNGTLLAIDLGMEPSGSRPVKAPCDALYAVEPDGWYGFPDHTCGVHVTAPGVDPPNRTAPAALLIDPPPLASSPLVELPAGARAHGFDFAPAGSPFAGQMFVALYGSYFTYPPVGHQVVRVDPATGEVRDFYTNLVPGVNGTAPDRPISVRFGPDGALYMVDFGELQTTTGVIHPSALTGALWRIVEVAEP